MTGLLYAGTLIGNYLVQKKSLKKKSIGIINDIFVQAVKPKNRIANPALKSYNHKFSFSNKLKN